MKAEQLKSKIRHSIATSIYSNPNSLGFKGYDDATEKCLKLVEQYVRIQIEKDRERLKEKINSNIGDYKKYLNPCKYIDETPITLE